MYIILKQNMSQIPFYVQCKWSVSFVDSLQVINNNNNDDGDYYYHHL